MRGLYKTRDFVKLKPDGFQNRNVLDISEDIEITKMQSLSKRTVLISFI